MRLMEKLRERRAQIKQGKLNRSKENIERLKAQLKETETHNRIISEESNLKAKLAKAEGPSIAGRIMGNVKQHLKKAKSSKSSGSIFGGSNTPPPFMQSMNGSNPFYPAQKKGRRK